MALDWLIIGGGIHGMHIAARLLGESGVAPERLRIVDPGKAAEGGIYQGIFGIRLVKI